MTPAVRTRQSGRLCIDAMLTGGEGPALARLERWRDPSELSSWLAECPLAVPDASATDADLVRGRALRWSIWHAVNAAVRGEPPAAHDAAVIEDAAAAPPLVPTLAGGWRTPTAAAALSTIARDAIDLLSDPAQRARLRVCAAPDCPVPFYDDSRPGTRRWCEPGRCGDRTRQRAHRARRKEQP
jgi:predicted RNA-binding Zn ribbon-like protein